MEIWKDVVGYEGLYQVSDMGRVKRLGNTPRCTKDRMRRLCVSKKGAYLVCVLSKDGVHKTPFVHRLVAEAFIPNPQNLPCINHKDENKRNNRVENLEWCTVEYNDNYGTRNERVCEKISKKVCRVDGNGNVLEVFASSCDADRRGYTGSAIRRCCAGQQRIHAGYHWRYL